MALKYHQAVFDLMGKKPRPSKTAVATLEKRERALGITLPASLKEFYSLSGAYEILAKYSNDDQTVPLEELGDAEHVAHGVIKIADENQGVAAWYVRLDGSEDPPVEVECEADRLERPKGVQEDDWTFWDEAQFHREADRFSTFVYQRVLAYGGGSLERKVAAKLKPYGGEIYFDQQGRADTVRFQARDPRGKTPAKPFDAVAVMGLVRKLERLNCLEVYTAKVGAGGWAVLKDHPGIVELNDVGSLDDAAVKYVIAMPALRKLSVANNRLTDSGLTQLLREHQFASLSIGVGKKMTSLGLVALEAQSGLEFLSLGDGDGGLTDESTAGVAGLASLRDLRFYSSRLTDQGLRHLSALSSLEHLYLFLDGITDAGFAHLAGLTSLTHLELCRCTLVTGDGFRHLTGLSAVRELKVRGIPIADESLAHLSGWKDLEILDLAGTKVVGPSFRFLSGLSRLRELDCGGTGFIDEGMPHLARLSSLERLDLEGAKITDAGLRALAPLQSLRRLELTGANVSASAIRDLKAAIPELSSVSWTRPGPRPYHHYPFKFDAKPGDE
jgi:hypothetical protein